MTTIQDGVHGRIQLSELAIDLIETPQMQRLRNISQLGTVDYVFPSANHTRFEHTLGVYHLAKKASQRLGIDKKDKEHVLAAAVLHDVGHSPFSHTFEEVIYNETGCYHDDVEEFLKNTEVETVLEDYELDFDRVTRLINGDGKYGTVISGELDVDRMDYLVRDASHTGVPYGTIDHEYLLDSLVFHNGVLAIKNGSIQSAENLLIARALMEPSVYRHHVARITASMLSRACQLLLEEQVCEASGIRKMDDYDFISAIRGNNSTNGLAKRLQTRNLFKRAVWTDLETIDERLVGLSLSEEKELAGRIANNAGDNVTINDVIVDSPSYPSVKETNTKVLVNDELRSLSDESPLVNAIIDRNYKQWRVGVYAPERVVDDVQEAAISVLQINNSGDAVIQSSNRVQQRLPFD